MGCPTRALETGGRAYTNGLIPPPPRLGVGPLGVRSRFRGMRSRGPGSRYLAGLQRRLAGPGRLDFCGGAGRRGASGWQCAKPANTVILAEVYYHHLTTSRRPPQAGSHGPWSIRAEDGLLDPGFRRVCWRLNGPGLLSGKMGLRHASRPVIFDTSVQRTGHRRPTVSQRDGRCG